MSTRNGDLTYRLIAAVYYDGSHYITVGRSSQAAVMSASTWVCWDGMHPGAVGVSCAPPTGEPGVRCLQGNAADWPPTFEPHVLLYCRSGPAGPSGSGAGPSSGSGAGPSSGSGAGPSGCHRVISQRGGDLQELRLVEMAMAATDFPPSARPPPP